ncbi:MAG: Molecular chaperone, heat shock protein Hsp40 [Myxococcales bacterium]|nr:Molecular chaperone, heat shock protein Hsp40 [Myxococcales bacterium]
MSQPLHGTVADRPWGVTLSALGLETRTAQLTLRADGKQFCVAFSGGLVIAATSPLAADSVARIALTSHLINSSQIGELVAQLQASPARDEIEVVAETAKLSAEQSTKLRHRLVAQRAARTFSIDRGDYVIEDRITLPVTDSRLDIRNVIYMGVRMNLSEQRLADDLREFGTRFVLKLEALDDLARFGFTDAERPIIAALRAGTSLPELEASYREIDPRTAQAVVYALASCDALTRSEPQMTLARAPTPRDPIMSRTPTPREPTVSRVPTRREPMLSTEPPPPSEPTVTRFRTPTGPRTYTESFSEGKATTVRPSPLSVQEVEALITEKSALLDQGVDHFTLLGVPLFASADEVRAAYLELARYLRPSKLAELGIDDELMSAQSLFAQVGIAFTVLTDPARRPNYIETLKRQTAAPPKMDPKTLAAEAFHRAELALRADQPERAVADLRRACELCPQDVYYYAIMKWAQFCAVTDKTAVAQETRRALEKAVHKSQKPEVAHFYLGRVERMLGRDPEALRHFQEVLVLAPGHLEAQSEVRVIEARLKAEGSNRTKRTSR